MKSIKGMLSLPALALVLTGFNSFAGEITGDGKGLKNEDGTLNGASECAYSGLNDYAFTNPGETDPEGFGRTQNWGQIPLEFRAFLTTLGFSPGDACNPAKN